MNRQSIFFLFGALLLVGCPEDKPAPKQQKAAPLTPASTHQAVTSTAAAAPTKAPPKGAPSGICQDKPKWIGRPPCVKDGYLYASGETTTAGGSGRGEAATRARRALALALGAHTNDKITLTSSEIEQVFSCGGTTYALGKVKGTKDTNEVAACAPDQLEPAPLSKGCPAWSRRLAWRDGDTYYGVAPAYRVMKRLQREQSAKNRARANVAELIEVELELTPTGVTAHGKPIPLKEVRSSKATCDGAEYVMVAFERGMPNGLRKGLPKVRPLQKLPGRGRPTLKKEAMSR